jgi:hypothetical protein
LEKTGHTGLNNLLAAYDDKSAYAQCIFSYSAGPGHTPVVFDGRTAGRIVPARGPADQLVDSGLFMVAPQLPAPAMRARLSRLLAAPCTREEPLNRPGPSGRRLRCGREGRPKSPMQRRATRRPTLAGTLTLTLTLAQTDFGWDPNPKPHPSADRLWLGSGLRARGVRQRGHSAPGSQQPMEPHAAPKREAQPSR